MASILQIEPTAHLAQSPVVIRNDWSRDEVRDIYELPLPNLIFQAQQTHRAYFDATVVQKSTLLSIKTGGCAEDCAYCPQSARHASAVVSTPLLDCDTVVAAAAEAKALGATRFCMGAAWRSPSDRNLEKVIDLIKSVKQLGMETCVTLGMLTQSQSSRLKEAGLDYYNHNIDTSPQFYDRVITTRTYADRLETLENVRRAGIHVCCGGIVGLGESREDRIGMLLTLATMARHPESVPINLLVRVEGTPLAANGDVDPIEFVRTIATARITMPASVVRLSAGRESMSDAMHALCFLAGANSIFGGEKLLTTPNPGEDRDSALFASLGMTTLMQ